MPSVNETPTSNSVRTDGWPAGEKHADGSGGIMQFTERVTLVDDATGTVLKTKLPPRCIVKSAHIKNATAVNTPTGGATGTADGYALVKVSAPSAIDDTASTLALAVQTTLTANARAMGSPAAGGRAAFANLTTSEATLYLMPTDSGGPRFYESHTTNGYLFSGSANVDVRLHIEQLPDTIDS